MNDYYKFLEKKRLLFTPEGFEVDKSDINSKLFDFQNDLTRYALRKGRAGIYATTGLGKTLMQSEWARLVCEGTKGKVLIVSPLGVAKQTVKLANELLDIEIGYSRDGKQKGNITITNYENLKKFNPFDYIGFVADESSIFKSEGGKYKQFVFDNFANTKYKLFCSATPSPNDMVEIINQCEGLSILDGSSVKSWFFVHESKGGFYRLKGHAEHKFYRWLASWGMFLTKPSDLGYDDNGFILPKLNIIPHFIDTDYRRGNELIFLGLKGIKDRISIRRKTLEPKCHEASRLINNSNEQWIVWCGLNPESELMYKLTKDSIEVAGKHDIEYKEKAFEDFIEGKIKVLISKPSICGFGMNFQNSWNNISIGMSDSFENFFQYIRRQYRFGQTHEVNSYLMLADVEREIYNNVLKKEAQVEGMIRELIKNVSQYEKIEIEKIYQDSYYQPDIKFELPLFMRNGKL